VPIRPLDGSDSIGIGDVRPCGRSSRARPSELLLIAQIALLIAVGRGLGEIMQRIG
jgi:hypothetical protein